MNIRYSVVKTPRGVCFTRGPDKSGGIFYAARTVMFWKSARLCAKRMCQHRCKNRAISMILFFGGKVKEFRGKTCAFARNFIFRGFNVRLFCWISKLVNFGGAFLLHVGCSLICKLESLGELKSYADGTGEGTSLAEVPSPEGPLAIWYLGQLGRVVRICLCVPVRHSFRECAAANRSARSRYSVLYVLIYKGAGFLLSLTEKTKCTSFDRQRYGFDA